jgi:hypothetical protein
VNYGEKSSLMAKLLLNSKEQLPLLMLFLERQLDSTLKTAFIAAFKGDSFEIARLVEEIDKELASEVFSYLPIELFEIVFAFFCVFVQEVGETKKAIYRKMPHFFELKETLVQALKRHTKLKVCLERFLLESFR